MQLANSFARLIEQLGGHSWRDSVGLSDLLKVLVHTVARATEGLHTRFEDVVRLLLTAAVVESGVLRLNSKLGCSDVNHAKISS